MSTGEFPGLHEAVSRSRIVQAANAVIEAVGSAAGSSATGPWVAKARAAFGGLTRVERLQWSATTLGWAVFIYWVGLAIMPPYTATGLPRSLFLAVAIMAWFVAGNAETVARAWPMSRVARMLHWLIT